MNWDKAISTGSLIEVEYTDDNGHVHKMKTLIDHPIKDGYFTIYAPMQKGAAFPMQEGHPIDIYFMMDNADRTDKDIYKLSCNIEQRGFTNNIPVYKLLKVGVPEKQQRRGAFRLDILKDFTFTLGEDPKVHHLTSINISATGMKAVSTEKLDSGSPITVQFDNDDEIFTIRGRLISCSQMPESIKNYELRIVFEELSSSIARKLNAFLYKKQSEFIAKNMLSDTTQLYHQIYTSEVYDPKIETEKRVVVYFNIGVFILMIFVFTSLYYAMPQDPQTIFKVLLKMNIATKQWNFEYVGITLITAFVTIVVAITGMLFNATIQDPKRGKLHIPLLICLIITGFIFLYTLTAFL